MPVAQLQTRFYTGPMLDWLILGGGIHGTILSRYLLAHDLVDSDGLRVMDPYETPLAVWRRVTNASGMHYLRSPSSHSLDIDFRALRRFARRPENRELADFIPPYARPALSLFDAHADNTIEAHGLEHIRLLGRAIEINRNNGAKRVRTAETSFLARNVVLAFSDSESPHYPEWAIQARQDGARIFHVFSPEFNPRIPQDPVAPAVIGGGITALQKACQLARAGVAPVTVIARHQLRVAAFDSNPCFVGPKCLDEFRAERDYRRRRAIIDAERFPGSVPRDVAEDFAVLRKQGMVRLIIAHVIAAEARPDGTVRLLCSEGGRVIESSYVLLATGFKRRIYKAPVIQQITKEFGLPIGDCGFPIPQSHMEWGENIFVTGALAELEVGPPAPNIIGAHNSARQLVAALR